MDKLFFIDSNVHSVIRKLVSKLIIPEFKKLTNHLKDSKIAITSDKIEKLLPKKLPKIHKKIIQNT